MTSLRFSSWVFFPCRIGLEFEKMDLWRFVQQEQVFDSPLRKVCFWREEAIGISWETDEGWMLCCRIWDQLLEAETHVTPFGSWIPLRLLPLFPRCCPSNKQQVVWDGVVHDVSLLFCWPRFLRLMNLLRFIMMTLKFSLKINMLLESWNRLSLGDKLFSIRINSLRVNSHSFSNMDSHVTCSFGKKPSLSIFSKIHCKLPRILRLLDSLIGMDIMLFKLAYSKWSIVNNQWKEWQVR